MNNYFEMQKKSYIYIYFLSLTFWDNITRFQTVKECDSDRNTSYLKIQAQIFFNLMLKLGKKSYLYSIT